jgi:ATP-dependent exoDNAse (exonuclease V) alpha subunit
MEKEEIQKIKQLSQTAFTEKSKYESIWRQVATYCGLDRYFNKKEITKYNVRDKVIFTKNIKVEENINKNSKNGTKEPLILQKGVDYKITSIDKNNNTIELEINTNRKVNLDISKYSTQLNLYTTQEKELIINDEIRWTSNNKQIGITKEDKAIIKDINKKNNTITIIKEKDLKDYNKQLKKLNKDNIKTNKVDIIKPKETILYLNNNSTNQQLKFFDYSYVSTTYSAQGKTSDNVIMTLESNKHFATQKNLYVEVSRVGFWRSSSYWCH